MAKNRHISVLIVFGVRGSLLLTTYPITSTGTWNKASQPQATPRGRRRRNSTGDPGRKPMKWRSEGVIPLAKDAVQGLI